MLYNSISVNIFMNIKVHPSIYLIACLIAAFTGQLDMANYALIPN